MHVRKRLRCCTRIASLGCLGDMGTRLFKMASIAGRRSAAAVLVNAGARSDLQVRGGVTEVGWTERRRKATPSQLRKERK